MKVIYTLLLPVCLFLSASSPVKAQIDSAAVKQHISVFADSLVRSYYEKDWDTFIRLTHPGIAHLYGGMEGYRSIVQGVRARFEDSMQEKKEEVTVKQFIFSGKNWQCVVERVRDAPIGGRNARSWSYMIGQSTTDDAAGNWVFFDVGDNLMINISAIMPDFSDELVVPQKKVVYEGDKDKTTAVAATAPKPKKKAAGKR